MREAAGIAAHAVASNAWRHESARRRHASHPSAPCPECTSVARDNARLTAELRSRRADDARSGARVVSAGDSQRRQLERDLHDGAQQRLVFVAIQLVCLAKGLAPGTDEARLLAVAREELAASLDELRELANGLHPAILDHGLDHALRSLATRAPVPVAVTVHIDRRPDASAEVAAYYLVSETLTNIAKYARATSATVTAARHDNCLVVEVVDDGVGGADPACGSGLRGLADRVHALGGSLCVESPPGHGTTVRAEIPCPLG
jgi:signal transduction histidine kinase